MTTIISSIRTAFIFTLGLSVLLFSFHNIFDPLITSAIEDQIVISQSVTDELSISSPADVTMSPNIPGISGGSATGTAKWTVTSSNATGFVVTHHASSTAMPGDTQGAQFDAYTQASGSSTPDYTWSVGATAAEFGYTVYSGNEPANVAFRFKDNGVVCNAGTNVTFDRCWKSASTTAETIFSSSASSSGAVITVDYQAELGASGFLVEDTYTATTTVTATNN